MQSVPWAWPSDGPFRLGRLWTNAWFFCKPVHLSWGEDWVYRGLSEFRVLCERCGVEDKGIKQELQFLTSVLLSLLLTNTILCWLVCSLLSWSWFNVSSSTLFFDIGFVLFFLKFKFFLKILHMYVVNFGHFKKNPSFLSPWNASSL